MHYNRLFVDVEFGGLRAAGINRLHFIPCCGVYNFNPDGDPLQREEKFSE